ncbi:hypothetical protein PLANPX_3240 [Lacipirellula parvula]|uniref:Sodium-solute symporter n=2 Tax=Lacipirellula parvula TaxID=2650471 RepID=A0A5K7XAR4_9BACT|nr:hypothetical protein PLANPX_3240 [Lacipirellula parvula]
MLAAALHGNGGFARAQDAPPTVTPSAAAEKTLSELSKHQQPEVAVDAIARLASLGYRNATQPLLTTLHPEASGTLAAVVANRTIAQSDDHLDARDEAIQHLIAVAVNAASPVRQAALASLTAVSGKPSDQQIKQLRDGCIDPVGEAYIAFIFPEVADKQKIVQSINLLSSQQSDDRTNAAFALQHSRNDPTFNLSTHDITAAELTPDDSVVAAYATLLFADSANLSQAKNALLSFATGDAVDRAIVCEGLAERGNQSDLSVLNRFLQDENPAVQASAATAMLRIDRRQERSFGWLDWSVLAIYAVAMLVVGWMFSGVTSAEEYLLGGRAMKPWAVGVSLFATLMSTMTYLAFPGEMIRHGPLILSSFFSFPLVYLVVGRLIIPFIMRLRVTSAYEILEQRFGLSVRMLGSSMFLMLRLFWMATIVYATADIVLVPLLNLDSSATPLVCAAMAILTIAYTSMGGLQAVVVIDVIQTFIMLAGALLSLALISIKMGGVGAWIPTEWLPAWESPTFFSPDSRISVGMAIVSTFTWYICTACSDQMAIQRYLATRDAPSARKMFGVSLVCDFGVAVILSLLGLALLAYFTAHPEMLPDKATISSSADELLPRFIVRVLPAGVAGLVVAGILSAAMDSLSSGLNSACSVINEDWINRFWPGPRRNELRQVKAISWIVGIAVIAVSFITAYVPGNLMELCYKVINLLVTPLASLFLLAMFVRWATTLGAWAATATSLAVAVGVAFFEIGGLSFIWIMPASLLTGIGMGCVASLLPVGDRPPSLAGAD